MSTSATRFAAERHVFLPRLVPPSQARALSDHIVKLVGKIQWLSDNQVPGSPALYGEQRMEELLVALLPQIEEASGLGLYPTCSYLRVYRHGDALDKHRDRPSCEISITLNLGYEADAPWPFWVEGPSGVASFLMEPGDAVLYRGLECLHWREAFAGRRAVQVFLHYVDRAGPHAEWKFDKRADWRVLERFACVR